MASFKERCFLLESEGVYIGGWGLKNILTPRTTDGKHDSSQDRIQAITVLDKDWSPEEERALVRKLDLRLLPACFIIFLLAYIDRGNIGSIRILQHGGPDSLEKTLNLHGTTFNWAVSATYFVMTAVLLPSVLLLKKFSAKIYCPTVMVMWGTIVACIATVKNGGGLIAARFFLGFPESGIGKESQEYITIFAKDPQFLASSSTFRSGMLLSAESRRERVSGTHNPPRYLPSERALRLGILFSANALGVGVSNLLALAIDNLNGKGGLRSWQWAFLLEGLASIVFAVPMYFALFTFPENEKSLNDRERHIAINRFGRGSTRKTDVTWDTPAFIRIMSRPSTYLFFVSYVCVFIMISGMANFIPSILLDFLGFSSLKANLWGAATAFVQVPLFWAWPLHSDWTRERMWHFVLPLLASFPAQVVWVYASTNPGQTTISPLSLYGMAFLVQLPIIAQPVLLTYRTATLYSATEQAVGVSVAFAAMSIASIIAPQMYPIHDAPNYKPAFISNVVIVGLAIITYIVLPYFLYREAQSRKLKTGHAMPLRAMEDAQHSQVTEVARQRIHEINIHEEAMVRESKTIADATHVERPEV
ncbi:hypothetical protein RBB50_011476 [Rhinocladiella similis]